MFARGSQQDTGDCAQVSPAPASAPGRGLSPASVLALQRAAGNRATGRYLQRMIVAIDGDKDRPGAKRATRACLWNLRYKKGGAGFVDGGARGAVAGPAVRRKLNEARGRMNS